ncbi:Uncharacterized protein APZ42_027168 [Daphnia magna]|uniref:Uncharacterized protein n=1 Tax=Daphnia magna TaxID=35525 RepID=A0A164RBT4_9CRUS|nr:Uncharacterized protein APZ42_027168 [Daphnia magna]
MEKGAGDSCFEESNTMATLDAIVTTDTVKINQKSPSGLLLTLFHSLLMQSPALWKGERKKERKPQEENNSFNRIACPSTIPFVVAAAPCWPQINLPISSCNTICSIFNQHRESDKSKTESAKCSSVFCFVLFFSSFLWAINKN